MKQPLYLLFTILTLNFSWAQILEKQNKFWVISMLGGKLYEKPTFKSKILTELKIGETLFAEKIIQTNETQNIGLNFSLSGDWIKTTISNQKGFVFSSELTKLNPNIKTNNYGQTTINLLGKELNKKIVKRTVQIEEIEFPIKDEITVFENGTYKYTAFDGCFDHITEYSGLKLNEVYHQMVSDYYGLMSDSETWIPIFLGKEGNIIKFEGEGATTDLKIEIKENGIIIVSSYDCD